MSEQITPWYEYPINGFDVAVRHLESCECESMPCEHVAKYNEARARLMDAFAKQDRRVTELERYISSPEVGDCIEITRRVAR